MCPYLARQLLGFSTAGSEFVSIVRRASGLRGVMPYVQCRAAVFPS
jgi:hypothetical protein